VLTGADAIEGIGWVNYPLPCSGKFWLGPSSDLKISWVNPLEIWGTYDAIFSDHGEIYYTNVSEFGDNY